MCSLSVFCFFFFFLWNRGRSTLVKSDWQWIFPECQEVLFVTLAGFIRISKMRYLYTGMCIRSILLEINRLCAVQRWMNNMRDRSLWNKNDSLAKTIHTYLCAALPLKRSESYCDHLIIVSLLIPNNFLFKKRLKHAYLHRCSFIFLCMFYRQVKEINGFSVLQIFSN